MYECTHVCMHVYDIIYHYVNAEMKRLLFLPINLDFHAICTFVRTYMYVCVYMHACMYMHVCGCVYERMCVVCPTI